MKKTILVLGFVGSLFWACEKEDDSDIVAQSNSIAEDIKQIIENENVEIVLTCPLGGSCSGGSLEFSFPGDNFILLYGDRYYNLNYLIRTEIDSDPQDRIQMTLYFDPY